MPRIDDKAEEYLRNLMDLVDKDGKCTISFNQWSADIILDDWISTAKGIDPWQLEGYPNGVWRYELLKALYND